MCNGILLKSATFGVKRGSDGHFRYPIVHFPAWHEAPYSRTVYALPRHTLFVAFGLPLLIPAFLLTNQQVGLPLIDHSSLCQSSSLSLAPYSIANLRIFQEIAVLA